MALQRIDITVNEPLEYRLILQVGQLRLIDTEVLHHLRLDLDLEVTVIGIRKGYSCVTMKVEIGIDIRPRAMTELMELLELLGHRLGWNRSMRIRSLD